MAHELSRYNPGGLSKESNRNIKGDYVLAVSAEGRLTGAYYFVLTTMDGNEYVLTADERDSLTATLSLGDTKFITVNRYELTIPTHQVKTITKEAEGIQYCHDGNSNARVYDLASALDQWPDRNIHYFLPKGGITWPVFER